MTKYLYSVCYVYVYVPAWLTGCLHMFYILNMLMHVHTYIGLFDLLYNVVRLKRHHNMLSVTNSYRIAIYYYLLLLLLFKGIEK